jgi:hypothetical protein
LNNFPGSIGRFASRTSSVVLREIRAHWEFFLVLAFYCGLGLLALRLNFATTAGSYPQGTNALNTYLILYFEHRQPLGIWLYPFTDWGQPIAQYPGIQPLNLLAGFGPLTPSELVRGTEFAAIASCGTATYFVLSRVGCTFIPSCVASLFYTLLAETPEFFEGHVNAMVSVALAAPFFYLVYRFFEAPKLRSGVPLVLVIFLLVTVGDLGMLYKYVFFAVPMTAILVFVSNWKVRYTRSEVLAVLCTVVLATLVILPWVVTLVAGVRPQFTTHITVSSTPFSLTSGQSLQWGLVGIFEDNSFTRFALGSWNYALDFSVTGPLFLIPPLIVLWYVVTNYSIRISLFYASGILALLISTGALYPGIASLNGALYDFVPFLGYDPQVFRWIEYLIFVNSVLLGLGLTKIEGRLQRALIAATSPRALSRDSPSRTAMNSVVLRLSRYWSPGYEYRKPHFAFVARRTAVVVTVIILGVGGLAIVQNWEFFSEPPGSFEIPSAYTEGFSYIQGQKPVGETLSVPFGNIYERTPWGGVSASSQLVAGIESGTDLDIFEAGTPQSLAIDTFVGNGLAYGYTNNLTKLLQGLNVNYLVTTQYPDWKYASDAIYDPIISLEGANNQVGLGGPVFKEGYQTDYRLASPSGNVTFSTKYLVYFGNSTLLYELLNEPWYNGSEVLVNGSAVTPATLPTLIDHAAGVITSPTSLGSLPVALLAIASSNRVPVAVIAGLDSTLPNSRALEKNLWNVSNGVEFSTLNDSAPIILRGGMSRLAALGYAYANFSARLAGPPGSIISVGLGNSSSQGQIRPVYADSSPLPYWNRSVVSAGINNHNAYKYTGSVSLTQANGTQFLDWNFTPNNNTLQYLNFDLHDFSGFDGLSVNVTSGTEAPLYPILQILFSGTGVTIPSYVSAVDLEKNLTTYSFYFPSATGPGARALSSNLTNITRFAIGFPTTGADDNVLVSNISGEEGGSDGFVNVDLGTLSLGGDSDLDVSAGSLCNFDIVTAIAGEGSRLFAQGGFFPDYLPQVPGQPIQTTIPASGWGIVQLAQTYSSLWTISNIPTDSPHFPVELGLNGWLVNVSEGATLHITYQGTSDLLFGLTAQAIFLPIVAFAIWILGPQGKRFWKRPTIVDGVPVLKS